jgi:glycosyltransferase involved in cell wall biosynthesis
VKARIMIDATSTSIGGGYTYLVNVIPGVCRRAPESRFRLLLRNAKLAEVMPDLPNLEIEQLPDASIVRRLADIYFEFGGKAAKWRADLYFSVGEMTPVNLPCPSIAGFQNGCVFSWEVKQPNFRERLRINTLWLLARLSALRCDRIFFVSEDSARWIGDSLRISEERRVAIHHGIDTTLWADAVPYRDHPRPYILTVGSIYKHKNFIRLIDAWVELAERVPGAPDLIIIGDDYDVEHAEGMEASRRAGGNLAERIHILGAVPYEDVRSYYAGAALFVFPSYLETFGIPLLEAMAAGVPSVASDIPVFREIAGDAAIYADPFDSSALAAAMEAALRPETSAKLIRRGHERLPEFSLDHNIVGTLELFQSTLGSD